MTKYGERNALGSIARDSSAAHAPTSLARTRSAATIRVENCTVCCVTDKCMLTARSVLPYSCGCASRGAHPWTRGPAACIFRHPIPPSSRSLNGMSEMRRRRSLGMRGLRTAPPGHLIRFRYRQHDGQNEGICKESSVQDARLRALQQACGSAVFRRSSATVPPREHGVRLRRLERHLLVSFRRRASDRKSVV